MKKKWTFFGKKLGEAGSRLGSGGVDLMVFSIVIVGALVLLDGKVGDWLVSRGKVAVGDAENSVTHLPAPSYMGGSLRD